MANPVEELMRTTAARVDPKSPPAGKYNKQFASIFTRLFGQGVSDEEIEYLSKFFIDTPEDVADLNALLRTNKTFRPRPDQVPLFDNELVSLDMPEQGVFRSRTRFSPMRSKGPATQTFDRVAFRNTPFIDIDFPSASHPSQAVTATGLRGAVQNILRYQKDAKAKGFNPIGPVYMTPAGVHYIEQGFEMDPRAFERAGLTKVSDPFYRRFSMAPTPLELAKHPSDFGIMAGGKEGFGRIEVDEFLRRRNPQDPGIIARRDVAGLLPPNFSVRTGPKRTHTGQIRVEKSPQGKVADFVKMKIGTLGEGTPTEAGLRATEIHDKDILRHLKKLQDEDPRFERAMRVSRDRTSVKAATLPKELKGLLGLDSARLAKAVRGGVPLIALLLVGALAASMTSDEA